MLFCLSLHLSDVYIITPVSQIEPVSHTMSFSSPHPSEASLPTFNKLGVSSLLDNINALKIASDWFALFSKKIDSRDIDGIANLMIQSSFDSALPETHDQPSVYWRDVLALTWDFRSFEGTTRIHKFLSDLLPATKISSLRLKTSNDGEGMAPSIVRPYPDLAWIMAAMPLPHQVVCSCTNYRRHTLNTSNGQLIHEKMSLNTCTAYSQRDVVIFIADRD